MMASMYAVYVLVGFRMSNWNGGVMMGFQKVILFGHVVS